MTHRHGSNTGKTNLAFGCGVTSKKRFMLQNHCATPYIYIILCYPLHIILSYVILYNPKKFMESYEIL